MANEPTIRDVLEAINTFSFSVDQRFMSVDQRFNAIDKRFEAIDERFEAIDQRFKLIDQRFDAIDKRFEAIDKRFDAMDRRFDAMDRRFDRIESTMVTKDYLDEELASLRGDLIVVLRKEDRKLEAAMDAKLLKFQQAVQ